MGPVVLKYAGDNTFGVILDTSNQWPQGPVLWTGPSVDITKAVVDAYNAQSGVAAPVPSAPQPSGAAKPSGATTRPVPPATPKPQRTQPPK
jgi:outer membrane protein